MDEETKAGDNPAPQPNAGDGLRTIPASEYLRLLQVETESIATARRLAAEQDAKNQAEARRLLEKGEYDNGLAHWQGKLTEAEKRYQDLESEVLTDRKSGVFAKAFAGLTFAGETAEERAEAAADLEMLLGSQFEAVRDSAGKVVVREKATHRPAEAALKEILGGKRFARYFASNGGGSNSRPAGNERRPDAQAVADPMLAQAVAHMAAQRLDGGFGLVKTG